MHSQSSTLADSWASNSTESNTGNSNSTDSDTGISNFIDRQFWQQQLLISIATAGTLWPGRCHQKFTDTIPPYDKYNTMKRYSIFRKYYCIYYETFSALKWLCKIWYDWMMPVFLGPANYIHDCDLVLQFIQNNKMKIKSRSSSICILCFSC